MKKTYMAVLFFLMTFIVCLLNSYLIKNTTKTVENYLTEIESLKDQSDFPEAIKKCAELNEVWDKKTKILSIFVHHESIDRITQALKFVSASLENKSSLETSKFSALATACLRSLRESGKISLENIF